MPLANRIIEATAVDVLVDQTAVTSLREALVREIGGFTDADALEILRETRFRTVVFPLLVENGEVQEEVNPVWAHPDFVAPLIAALAQLFDSCLSPTGDARFTCTFTRQPRSLYGLGLEDLSIADPERFDRDVFALMMAGAARSFMTNADGRALALWAVRAA